MAFNRSFFSLLVVISIAEFFTMVTLTHYAIPDSYGKNMLDPLILAVIISPFIYYFAGSQERLKKSRQELEQRVSERTADLEDANRRLTDWTKELEQFNSEFSMLLQFGDLLQSCRTLDEAYAVIKRSMAQLFPDSGAVYLFNNSRNMLEAAVIWGDAGRMKEYFYPDDCWAIKTSKPNAVCSNTGVPCGHVKGSTFYTCVPVITQGESIGVLHILWPDNLACTQSHRTREQMVLSIAEHIGLAVQNLKLRESLQELSIKDPLTGLFNRRHMDAELERELCRAKRKKGSIGLIMADLDHFKQFNDTFGHDAGDVLLKEVGMLLVKSIRACDIACRYGGEEFLLILPDASPDAARQRAEEIRKSVKQMHVVYQGGLFGPVSLSIGVSAFPDSGGSAEKLLLAADEALYRAKKGGRDRVCVAGEEKKRKFKAIA